MFPVGYSLFAVEESLACCIQPACAVHCTFPVQVHRPENESAAQEPANLLEHVQLFFNNPSVGERRSNILGAPASRGFVGQNTELSRREFQCKQPYSTLDVLAKILGNSNTDSFHLSTPAKLQ